MICWPDAAYVSGWLLVEEGADGAAPPTTTTTATPMGPHRP
jgi:hypothetical protein